MSHTIPALTLDGQIQDITLSDADLQLWKETKIKGSVGVHAENLKRRVRLYRAENAFVCEAAVTFCEPEDEIEEESIEPEPQPHGLLWIDFETTGLEPEAVGVYPIEVALQLTTFEYPYEPLGEPVTALFCNMGRDLLLNYQCNDFIRDMHEKNGLRAALEDESATTTMSKFEGLLLDISKDWPLDRDTKVRVAGNTVDFDLRFLRVFFPTFTQRLSHQKLDVSSIMLFCRGHGMPRPPKEEAHRALPDILQSMRQARGCAEWLGLAPTVEELLETDEETGLLGV